MNFGLGVLAGVVATFVTGAIVYSLRYILGNYVGYLIIEKILIRFPTSRNLSGIWETEFWKAGGSHKEIAKVSQLFDRVWGVIEFRKDGNLRKYRMGGTIKEGVLSATYDIMSPKNVLDRGSFTLVLSKDGKSMEGCYSWTDDNDQVPQGNKYVWVRPLYKGTNGLRIKQSKIHGKGVFTTKEIPRGSDVSYFDGYEVEHDTRHSLTFDGCKIEPTGPLQFLNHSCDPNCNFRGRTLVARKRLRMGDELTIDYLATEEHLSHPFKCKCGCTTCKRKIG